MFVYTSPHSPAGFPCRYERLPLHITTFLVHRKAAREQSLRRVYWGPRPPNVVLWTVTHWSDLGCVSEHTFGVHATTHLGSTIMRAAPDFSMRHVGIDVS